jgi:hypothetical protein
VMQPVLNGRQGGEMRFFVFLWKSTATVPVQQQMRACNSSQGEFFYTAYHIVWQFKDTVRLIFSSRRLILYAKWTGFKPVHTVCCNPQLEGHRELTC